MRVLLILLLTRQSLSWYACDRRLCFNETNGICDVSQENSDKKKYCDVSVSWKDSCRTDSCYYIFDISQSVTNNNKIVGTITSVKKMVLSNDINHRARDRAHCWSYMMLPETVNHFYFKRSHCPIGHRTHLDVGIEFKMEGAHDELYVVSIPCDENEERYPSLARKDIIIYFLNEPRHDKAWDSATEYKIQWIASSNKKYELSSWKHLGKITSDHSLYFTTRSGIYVLGNYQNIASIIFEVVEGLEE